MAGSKRQLKNGKWELCISLGYDGMGKQIRKYKTIAARSERAAERELARFFAEASSKPVIGNYKLNLRDFIEIWNKRYAATLERTTAWRDNEMLRQRILPALGNIKLQKLDDDDILRFIGQLRQPGMRLDGKDGVLSDRSVQMYYKLIHSILNKAVEWKYIGRNPCDSILGDNIPKAKSRRLPILQDKDLAQFLHTLEALPDTAHNLKYKLMVSLCLITGARRGEFMALTWDSVDMGKKRLQITKACEVIPNRPVGLKKPKTESSVRSLELDDYTVALLQRHQALQQEYLTEKDYKNPQGFIFLSRLHKGQTPEVSQAHPSCFYQWLQRFCARHGLPRITVHSFRHMAASYALAHNVPLTTVQTMLGHTNIKTTSIYLHDLESKRKEAAIIMSSAFAKLREEEYEPEKSD